MVAEKSEYPVRNVGINMYLKETRFKGYYISPCGQVWSTWSKGRFLKQPPDIHGYPRVDIRGKHRKVHILVALAYLDNPLGLPVVNHLDEDKLNSNDWNLQWCTHQQNSEHSLAIGGELLDPMGNIWKFNNTAAFCRAVGLDPTQAGRVLKGKRKTHKGWKAVPQGFVRG